MNKNLTLLLIISFTVLIAAFLAVKPRTLFPGYVKFIPKQFSKEVQESKPKKVTIIFGGDLMFDRYIRQKSQEYGYDHTLVGLKEVLDDADFVIANLEGPITNYSSVSIGSKIGSKENYVFTFDPKIVETLKDYDIGPVSIGNNHILNFGYDGLRQTLQNLDEGKIKYFGDISDGSVGNDLEQSTILDEGGIRIGIVNYNEFYGAGVEKAINETKLLKNRVEWVIIYAHWGTEYIKTSPQYIQEIARRFVDAGANTVIGSHPHVTQQSEEYSGAKIYYSLGNFVMDQYFNEDVRSGLLVKMELFSDGNVVYSEIPIYMDTQAKTILKD